MVSFDMPNLAPEAMLQLVLRHLYIAVGGAANLPCVRGATCRQNGL